MMKEKKMKHKMMAAAQEKGAAEGDLLLSVVCTSGLYSSEPPRPP